MLLRWGFALVLLGATGCREPLTEPPRPPAPNAAVASARSAPAEPPASAAFSRKEPVDVWIHGGEIVDGSGAARRKADVVIVGDTIVHVGAVALDQAARTTLDATGRVVTPGFIDLHAHTDPLGRVDHLLAMGVTTIVVGQDGDSPASRVGAYLSEVEAARPRLNVATLVGHGTIRARILDKAESTPSDVELSAMAARVDEALDEGAFGLSLGLEYDAGKPADARELRALIAPVGRRGAVVMSHLRSEDDASIDAAIDELLLPCRETGARAHISHLKIVLGRGEARAAALLEKLAVARREGVRVSADLYPYTASYTTIGILFPDFARPPNAYAKAKRKRREELARHLRERVTARNGPSATVFGTGRYEGRSLEEVATAERRAFEDVLIDLGPTGASATYYVMDEAVMRALMRDPFVSFGTDGAAAGAHPRGRGTFARAVGRYVRDERVLTLEEAVHKASVLAAESLGLRDRGSLAAGMAADLVVLDPATLVDRADFAHPERKAEGVDAVVVGGQVAWLDGRTTDARGGHALRRRDR